MGPHGEGSIVPGRENMIHRRAACGLAFFVAAALAAPGAVPSAAGQAAAPPPATAPAPAPTPAAAPAETPSFPSQVEQVVVDAVVVDKKGMPVRGLTREDFRVFEDDVPQSIVSFDAVDVPSEPQAVPPPPPRVSVNTDVREQRGRTFVLVFDDMNMEPAKANPAKAAVASFLRTGVREGDRVELISTSGETWWSARMEEGREQLIELVKRLQGRHIPEVGGDRISDWEAYMIHVYEDPQTYARVLRRFQTYDTAFAQSQLQGQSQDPVATQATIEDPYIRTRATETYQRATVRLRTTLDILERAINGLVGAKGRKSVVLVSPGFIFDTSREEFRHVKAAARRANAVLYFVNTRGLEGMPSQMTAEFGSALPAMDLGMTLVDSVNEVAGSEDLATASGGFVVSNTNDLASGIQKIARENQAYYLLGYMPTNPARDGKFREIEVKLKSGKGLTVRARKGYYAPTATGEAALPGKEGIDPALQAALDSPWDRDKIPLRMTDYVGDEQTPGKAAVIVATEVNTHGFDFEVKDGRYCDTLDFLLVVAHLQTGEFYRYDQSVVMSMLPATKERVDRFWYPIARNFELRPGDYQAKIVVRDARSGRVGTVMHDFTVPDFTGFRVSTPVVSDALATGRAEGGAPGARLDVIVRREFPEGSDVYCQIDVFGAQKDRSGMPRVLQGYFVRREDGTVLTAAMPSEIRPTSLGGLSRVSGFSLKGAQPGSYEIVMSVRDELARRSLELREPFKVIPASGETAPAAARSLASPPGGGTP
jgi:VWFA-related protein